MITDLKGIKQALGYTKWVCYHSTTLEEDFISHSKCSLVQNLFFTQRGTVLYAFQTRQAIGVKCIEYCIASLEINSSSGVSEVRNQSVCSAQSCDTQSKGPLFGQWFAIFWNVLNFHSMFVLMINQRSINWSIWTDTVFLFIVWSLIFACRCLTPKITHPNWLC